MTTVTEAPWVVTVDPRHDPLWNALAAGPRGGLFVSPPWISAVCATYGFSPLARIVLDKSGDPVGGFAWVTVRDFRGTRVCSLPFSDWADPICSDEETWTTLSATVLGSELPLRMRCLHAKPPQGDSRLWRSGAAAWNGIRLDAPYEELLSRFPSSARRRVRHSERCGIRVQAHTDIDAVHALRRLHLHLRKQKYRILAQPAALFNHVWDQFSRRDSIVTLLAYLEDRPIAGIVFLLWRGVLHSKFAASLPEFSSSGANDAVYTAGIRWGVEHEVSMVDWGVSDMDQPGLIRFKDKYSTEHGQVVSLRSTPPTATEVETERVLQEVTTLLTEPSVPDRVTENAGTALYRYFC